MMVEILADVLYESAPARLLSCLLTIMLLYAILNPEFSVISVPSRRGQSYLAMEAPTDLGLPLLYIRGVFCILSSPNLD